MMIISTKGIYQYLPIAGDNDQVKDSQRDTGGVDELEGHVGHHQHQVGPPEPQNITQRLT